MLGIRLPKEDRLLRHVFDPRRDLSRRQDQDRWRPAPAYGVEELQAVQSSRHLDVREDGSDRFWLKGAREKEDLAAGLSGRVNALASAQTLVLARGGFGRHGSHRADPLHRRAARDGRRGRVVAIDWRQEGEDVVLRWSETGGEPIKAEPERHGFGTRLLESSIERQFKGAFAHDWRPMAAWSS
jgi:hypothetical protein